MDYIPVARPGSEQPLAQWMPKPRPNLAKISPFPPDFTDTHLRNKPQRVGLAHGARRSYITQAPTREFSRHCLRKVNSRGHQVIRGGSRHKASGKNLLSFHRRACAWSKLSSVLDAPTPEQGSFNSGLAFTTRRGFLIDGS